MDKKLFIPTPVPTPILEAARSLRHAMTDAEQSLWHCLRRKQLGGFRFRRQHPVERFILDFYCCEVKLAIELDGGQHNEPDAKARDKERSELLSGHGIQVIRFWNNEVFANTEGVLQRIYDVLLERASQQTPPP
jgi:very-short-patch-repair endonuclease